MVLYFPFGKLLTNIYFYANYISRSGMFWIFWPESYGNYPNGKPMMCLAQFGLRRADVEGAHVWHQQAREVRLAIDFAPGGNDHARQSAQLVTLMHIYFGPYRSITLSFSGSSPLNARLTAFVMAFQMPGCANTGISLTSALLSLPSFASMDRRSRSA